jgi:DNA polymerase-3 subunit delta'
MWQAILGHDDVAERFRRTLRRGRLASTYLFVGPSGIGKRLFALTLAKALLCQAVRDDPLEPCGSCDSCRLFDRSGHPDLDFVSLPPEKSSLPIDLFIGDKEHRNREGICHRLALKPYMGGRKIAIIGDADCFNQESANCLLKTLEEPPPKSLAILIGTSESKQLPTIRSRAQVLHFRPLARETVASLLIDRGWTDRPEQAEQLAAFSEGSVEKALSLAEQSIWDFRSQLFSQLSANPLACVRTARSIQAFVDEAGKEARRRRERLRIVVAFALDYLRSLLRSTQTAPGSAALPEAAPSAHARGPFRSTDSVLGAIEACLAALEHIDRNANLALLIQKLCEDLVGASKASV